MACGRLFLTGILLLTGCVGMPAQSQPDHLRVSLISERSGVVPRQKTQLGLRFQLDAGWHIYWINSGDSGEPPKVKWHVPPGFTMGELQFPRPERLDTPPLTDYGYRDEVLLPVSASVPNTLQTGAAEFDAEVRWLVCREICIPGRRQLRLKLPVVKQASASAEAPLFVETRKHLPASLPKGWHVSAHSRGEFLILTLTSGARISHAAFFPLEAQQIENSFAPALEPFAQGIRLKLKKSDQLLKPLHDLRGLLVIGEHGYSVAVPVGSRDHAS